MFQLEIQPELYERVVQSPAVRALEGAPRFDNFMHRDTNPSDWIGWLDIDFDNRQHLVKTALIASGICAIEQVDETVTQQVVLTALAHDAAESITTDKSIHLKQDGDDEAEIAIMNDMVADRQLDLTPEEFEIVSAIMLDKHSSKDGPATLAGKLFDMAEMVGYVYSGATAWRAATESKFPIPQPQRQLMLLLAVQVFSYWPTRLARYHDEGMETPAYIYRSLHTDISSALTYGNNSWIRQQYQEHLISREFPPEKVRELVDHIPGALEHWYEIGNAQPAA